MVVFYVSKIAQKWYQIVQCIIFDVSPPVQVTYYSNFLTIIPTVVFHQVGLEVAMQVQSRFGTSAYFLLNLSSFFTCSAIARILNRAFWLFQKLTCKYIFVTFRLNFFNSLRKINLKHSYKFRKPFWIYVPIYLNGVLIWHFFR